MTPFARRRALSLAELLVVLAIIALVSVVAIPTVTSHMERARLASAQTDCRSLAMAEDACAAVHGFYVPLQVLDDLPGSQILNNDADRIGLETSIRLIDPLLLPELQIGLQPLVTDTANGRVTALRNEWAGPFLDFRRATNTPDPPSQADQRNDLPLDPYGQPYRFFSPIGIIGSNANLEAIDDPENLSASTFSDGVITRNEDQYERYTVMSTGRDTRFDEILTLEQGDDIVHHFGVVGFETGSLVRFPF